MVDYGMFQGKPEEWVGTKDGKVDIKRLQAQLGLGRTSLFERGKKIRVSPLTEERMRFEKDVREQFVKLKEKGLSIPVFTL